VKRTACAQVASIAALVAKEKKSAGNNTKQLAEHESRLTTLVGQEASLVADVQASEAALAAARAEVTRLEEEVGSKAAKLAATQSDVQSVQSRLAALRSEAARIREALTLGEKSLTIARGKSAEARALLNPLNHPLVQGKVPPSSKR
jgi:chromosome segregation ATPase